jgi:preprotein translocase subunit SecD
VHARRNHLILVGIILATLVGVVLLAVPGSPIHKKTRLGLDLQGGLEVVLQAVPPKGQKVTQQGLDNAVSIMRQRVDKLGVAEPEIRKQGNDQIVIELPGVKNATQAAQLIGKTAQLEFYDLQADLTGPSVTTSGFARIPVATPSLFNLLAGQQAKAKQAERSSPSRPGRSCSRVRRRRTTRARPATRRSARPSTTSSSTIRRTRTRKSAFPR